MKSTWNRFKQSTQSFGQQVGEWVIRKRWWVIVGTLSLAMLAGYGAKNLAFNTDYHVFFSDDNPQLKAFDALNNKYTQDDNVFITIVPKDGKVFTKSTLSAIEDLVSQAWKTPFSSRVDAITNFQHTRAVEDDLYVDDLLYNTSEKTDEEIVEAMKIAVKEPILRNRLINEDASITAVNITVMLPGEVMGEDVQVAQYVRQIVAEFEQNNPNLDTYLSGMIMLSGAFGEAAQNDMSTLMPAMFLGIILLMFLTTRSIPGTISTVVVLMLSIITGMGIAGWMGIELTAPSSATPIMIMSLAIADSIHILITMLQNMRIGMGKKEAIVESLRVNFMPVFITSLTTVIGFLTMNFSDAPPFHDMGNITAIGITGAFIFSILTLPALMSILPVRVKVRPQTAQKTGLIGKLAEFVIQHNKKLVWASAFAVIGISSLVFKNELNDEFIKYFDESIEFRRDTDLPGIAWGAT